MDDFGIPHLAPIRFVRTLKKADETSTIVKVGFDEIPTLGMLIEAAAQSSSGINDAENNGRMGFVITLKNVKLLQDVNSKEFDVHVKLVHKLDDFKSLSFSIFEDETEVATGAFSIVLQ
jgi:hypothetical protein